MIEFTHKGEPIRFNRIPHESYARATNTQVIVRYEPQSPQTSAYILAPWNGILIWLPFVMAALAAPATEV